jgi:hypothetical protein
VQSREDAEASHADISERSPGESGQPLAPQRQSEQRLDNGRDVSAMVRKGVPLELTTGRTVSPKLAPKSRRLTSQISLGWATDYEGLSLYGIPVAAPAKSTTSENSEGRNIPR